MNEINHNNLEIQNQEIARQSEAQAEQNAKQHEEFGRKLESNNLSMGDNYGELKQIEGQDKASKDISEVDRGDKDLAENRKLDIHGEQDIENTGEDEEHSQLVSLSTIGGENFAETFDFDEEELSAEENALLNRAELDYPIDETSDFDEEELSAEENALLSRAELDYPIDETSDFDAEELSDEEYDLPNRTERDLLTQAVVLAGKDSETANLPEVLYESNKAEDSTAENHNITANVKHSDGAVTQGESQNDTPDSAPENVVSLDMDTEKQRNPKEENAENGDSRPDVDNVRSHADGAEENAEVPQNEENSENTDGDMTITEEIRKPENPDSQENTEAYHEAESSNNTDGGSEATGTKELTESENMDSNDDAEAPQKKDETESTADESEASGTEKVTEHDNLDSPEDTKSDLWTCETKKEITGSEGRPEKSDAIRNSEEELGNRADELVKSEVVNQEEKSDVAEKKENNVDQQDKPAETEIKVEQPKRFEDYSSKELWSMMDNPDTREKLISLLADDQERYLAECRGMSVDEYRAHCALCESADAERKENGEEASYPLSETQQKALQLLDRYDSLEEKTSTFRGSSMEQIDAAGREGSAYLTELESTRADIKIQIETASEEFAKMKEDGTMLSDPEAYKQKYSELADLRTVEHALSNRVVKIGANLEYLSEISGRQYGDFEKKPLSYEEIDKTVAVGENICKTGVLKKDSIVEAIRVADKLETEVLPSLHGKMRECDRQLSDISSLQENYLKEYNCTREEAMADESSSYSKAEQQKENILAEKEAYSQKYDETLILSQRMHEALPVSGQDRTLSITKNNDGTFTVDTIIEKGTYKASPMQGKLFSNKEETYVDSTYYKDTCVFSQFDGQLKNRTVEYHSHGLGYKRETVFGTNDTNLKNTLEGNILNRNFNFSFSKGDEGKVTNLQTSADFSLFEAKTNTAVTVKGREIISASADMSAGKFEGSAKADANGIVTLNTSGHALGIEATGKIGEVQVAKIECKIDGFEGSVSTWDSLTGKQETLLHDNKIALEVGGKSSLYKNEIKDAVQQESCVPLENIKDTLEAAKNGEIKIDQEACQNLKEDIESLKKQFSPAERITPENKTNPDSISASQHRSVNEADVKKQLEEEAFDAKPKHMDVGTESQDKFDDPEQTFVQKEALDSSSDVDGEEKDSAEKNTDVNDRPKVSYEEILEKKEFPKVMVNGQLADMWIEVTSGGHLWAKTLETKQTSFMGIFKREKTEEKIIGGMYVIDRVGDNQINLDSWASAEGTKGVGSVMMEVLQSYARENGYSISAQAAGSDGSVFGFKEKSINLEDLPQIYRKFGFVESPTTKKHMIWTPDKMKEADSRVVDECADIREGYQQNRNY